ncbi:MAG: hypothetical protein ACU4EQ_08385 [Candidatus Nitrosoglobus sp.]
MAVAIEVHLQSGSSRAGNVCLRHATAAANAQTSADNIFRAEDIIFVAWHNVRPVLY